jgi:hypothetical protein
MGYGTFLAQSLFTFWKKLYILCKFYNKIIKLDLRKKISINNINILEIMARKEGWHDNYMCHEASWRHLSQLWGFHNYSQSLQGNA